MCKNIGLTNRILISKLIISRAELILDSLQILQVEFDTVWIFFKFYISIFVFFAFCVQKYTLAWANGVLLNIQKWGGPPFFSTLFAACCGQQIVTAREDSSKDGIHPCKFFINYVVWGCAYCIVIFINKISDTNRTNFIFDSFEHYFFILVSF